MARMSDEIRTAARLIQARQRELGADLQQAAADQNGGGYGSVNSKVLELSGMIRGLDEARALILEALVTGE